MMVYYRHLLKKNMGISTTVIKSNSGFQTPTPQPFDVTKNAPVPERQIVQQPITLGSGSKSDIGYRGTGLGAAFEENINGGYASPSQIAESEKLQKIQQAYKGDKKSIQKAQSRPLDTNGQIVQGFADEDLEGNRAGYLYNKVLEGVGQISSGAGRNIYGALGAFSTGPNVNLDAGLQASGEFEREYAPSVREYLKENVGATVDKRLENKYNGETFTSAIGGLASSAPAIAATIASGGVGTAAMGLQMFDNAIESINSTEEGRSLDEGTKTFFAGGVAIAQTLLEKYSLDKILKSESGLISNLLTKQALKNAVKATDGKVTGDVFTKFLDKEVLNLSNKFAIGGARALDAALLEYGTEFAQEGAAITGELLTNSATGKPVFDTEKVDNWNGFLSNLQRANKAGIAGAIGGGVLGSVSALAKLNKNKIEQNDQVIAEIDKNLVDENLSDATREILVQNKIKLQNEQQEYADKIDETYDKLDAKSKDKVNEIVEQKLKIQEAILDPAVTPEIKTNLEEQSKELDKELGDIKPQETVNLTFYDQQDIPSELRDRVVEKTKNNIPYFEVELEKTEAENYRDIPVEDIFLNKQQRPNQENVLKANEFIKQKRANKEGVTEITSKTVSVSDIIPTQKNVKANNLQSVVDVETNENPTAILENGKYYLLDGHHRIANDINNGIEQVKIDVVDLNKEIKPVEEVKVTEEVITPKEEVKVVEEVKPSSKQIVEVNGKQYETDGSYVLEVGKGNLIPLDGDVAVSVLDKYKNKEVKPIENESTQPVPKTENVEKIEVPVKEEAEQVEETKTKAGDSARNFANKIREGKINKLGGFRAGTGFDAAWDLGIEAVALSIEGGAKIADAIQSGLEAIKKTDWYKGLEDKENFDKQYNDHMQKEYEVVSKESTGITKEQIDATRKELGLEEVKRVSKSDIELKKQADEWMEKNSIPDLISKLEKGALPSDIENVVMRNYISSLEAKNDKSPSAELLKDINRATKVITSARSELGRALRSGKGEIAIEDNLSNFLLDEMDAMGVNTMPQSMIDELAEKYAKGKAAKDAYEEGYEKAKQEFIKQQAETALSKERAKARNRGNVKKTAADYEAERAVYKKSIKDKLRQARSQANAVPVPYLAELIAISPDVAKMVRSYVEQGVSKLDDLVKKIQSDLEEDFEGITENDVRDLIAGEYNAKRPTKNQITADIRELRQQAKLLKQIEDLENGKLPMTESGKIRRTQEIDKLKERIKELEDETGISEAKSIKSKRNYLDKQIDKLRDDLETGNYDIENPVPRKMKLDPETQAKQDEYIKFQKETWKRRDAAKYEQLSKLRKAWEKFQQFLGLRRLIQTSLDFSMPFRQAITLTLNPRYVRITAESFANMFKGWASEKQFDRIMFAIENDPLYKDMLEDKLVFSDVDSKDNLKRDEDFRTSFLYHIPYLRLPFLASNRAAAGFVNTARYELYLKGVERLKSAGITRETNPDHYKSLANWVMNMTGRGKLLEFMENSVQAQRVLGDTFYGARLMASRFNLLNPNTYAKMPKEVRVEALKDMGAYASVAAATLIGLAAAGAAVSLDPDDPDFLKAKWGDKRYDFTTGGMSVYLRFYFKLAKAIAQRLNPKIYGENKDKALLKKYDKYGSHALKNSTNFFRYKLAPNTSYVISGIAGKDALGNEFDPSEFLNFYPMYTEDMIDAYKKDEGALSTFTVLLPNLFGVGMQEYSNKKQSGEAKTPAERERMRNESRREREKSREDSRNNR